ncbi:MAG: T9SS type A sorting domain-containing protein [Bacteroidales bacterium]|nr:T9SS type A sorting domain-containing protein [Bacteroidales bacterium]
MGKTNALNEGFNDITLWADYHYNIVFDVIRFATEYEFVAQDLTSTTDINEISTSSFLKVAPNVVKYDDLNISFKLSGSNNVEINLFSLDGRLVSQLLNQTLQPGDYTKSFGLENISNGMYICSVKTGTE